MDITMALQNGETSTHECPCIKVQTERKGMLRFFKYDTVLHIPLELEDAQKCLPDLLQNLHATIEAYHALGWGHQDIRLENVCFNEEFKPVLIDLDRSCPVGDSPIVYEGSYMYEVGMSVKQTDYRQLGLMAAWIVCPSDPKIYHSRKIDDLADEYKNDPFLEKLIREGMQ